MMYLVDSVQTIGQFTATTFGAMDRQPTDKEISGAIMGSGLANFLGSLFGSVPCATFGQKYYSCFNQSNQQIYFYFCLGCFVNCRLFT